MIPFQISEDDIEEIVADFAKLDDLILEQIAIQVVMVVLTSGNLDVVLWM